VLFVFVGRKGMASVNRDVNGFDPNL